MPRLLRPTNAFVRQEIQTIIRTFPSRPVEIVRRTGTYDTQGDETVALSGTRVYFGEALFVPAGGQLTLEGYGLVAIQGPLLLISGHWPFQQGDRTRIDRAVYEVAHAPDPWHAFALLRLKQVEEIA